MRNERMKNYKEIVSDKPNGEDLSWKVLIKMPKHEDFSDFDSELLIQLQAANC